MAEQIQKMIDDITADVRALQAERGAWIVFDPTSEASRLCDTKLRLQAELRRVRGW